MASPLRQTSHSAGHWRFLPPFFFCGCWCNFFFTAPFLCVSRPEGDFFNSAFFDPAIGRRLAFAFFPFFFDHFDWQKLFSNQKKMAMQALFPPQWRAPRIWVLPKWKTKIVGRPTASIGRSPLSKPKDHRHAKLELKERAIFPAPLTVQDFDRRSNPNCPFNHAQANLTTHEHRRRLHEKFFAPGVNNRRFPSPKTKPCEKLKKSFLFAIGHSLSFPSLFLFFFSRFTVALSNSKQTWPRARKNWKSPDVQKLALVPPLARLVPPFAQVGFADLLLFVTLPIFSWNEAFCTKTKLEDLAFQNTRQNLSFPTETICRILYSTRSRALR